MKESFLHPLYKQTEEVEEDLPCEEEVYSEGEGKETEDEFLAVNYTELIPVLIKAVQEQQEEITMLKAALQQKQATETSLDNRLKKIEKLLLASEQ